MLTKTPGSTLAGIIPGIFFMPRPLNSVAARRPVPQLLLLLLQYIPDLLRLHLERSTHLDTVIANRIFDNKRATRFTNTQIPPLCLTFINITPNGYSERNEVVSYIIEYQPITHVPARQQNNKATL